jgi:hypothetical protein
MTMKKENKAKALEFMHAFAAAHGVKVEKKKGKKRIVMPVQSVRSGFQEILIDIINGLAAHGIKMHDVAKYDEKHKRYELSRHFTARLGHLPDSTKPAYILEFS